MDAPDLAAADDSTFVQCMERTIPLDSVDAFVFVCRRWITDDVQDHEKVHRQERERKSYKLSVCGFAWSRSVTWNDGSVSSALAMKFHHSRKRSLASTEILRRPVPLRHRYVQKSVILYKRKGVCLLLLKEAFIFGPKKSFYVHCIWSTLYIKMHHFWNLLYNPETHVALIELVATQVAVDEIGINLELAHIHFVHATLY